jgi:biopolymer transport protein ExbD
MSMQVGDDGGGENEPMMEINTTPLIDVMLVLLIMFIITIPIQTHAVKLDLPQSQNNNPPPVDATKNVVTIDPRDQVYWNGSPIQPEMLRSLLLQTVQMDPQPELHIEPDAQARYDTVDKVLAIAKRAQVEKLGFVGNEKYSYF